MYANSHSLNFKIWNQVVTWSADKTLATSTFSLIKSSTIFLVRESPPLKALLSFSWLQTRITWKSNNKIICSGIHLTMKTNNDQWNSFSLNPYGIELNMHIFRWIFQSVWKYAFADSGGLPVLVAGVTTAPPVPECGLKKTKTKQKIRIANSKNKIIIKKKKRRTQWYFYFIHENVEFLRKKEWYDWVGGMPCWREGPAPPMETLSGPMVLSFKVHN